MHSYFWEKTKTKYGNTGQVWCSQWGPFTTRTMWFQYHLIPTLSTASTVRHQCHMAQHVHPGHVCIYMACAPETGLLLADQPKAPCALWYAARPRGLSRQGVPVSKLTAWGRRREVPIAAHTQRPGKGPPQREALLFNRAKKHILLYD